MTQPQTEFFVDDVAETIPPIVVDRSTLERWAECPHQAWHVDHKTVSTSSIDTEVGSAAHDIISAAAGFRANDGLAARDLRELIQERALRSRPDIQPMVLAALRSTYAITELICTHENGEERSPDDLLKYDGGDGLRCGQLAGDLLPAADDGSRGALRLTSELDLLLATPSPEELEIVDWKSGWRHWTASEVKDSFQFQFQAWLVFRCYPKVKCVRTRVFMTREGQPTSAVEFTNRDVYAIYHRLRSAAETFLRFREANDAGEVPAWPAPTRCSLCPVAHRCIECHRPASDLAVEPEACLRQYAALQASADSMKAALTAAVRQRGQDFEFDGIAFGTNKPTTPRAKVCDVYEIKESRKAKGAENAIV